MRPHEDRVKEEDHLCQPAGHTLLKTRQDTAGLLGNGGTLLAHVQPVAHQDPQVLLHGVPLHQVIP